MQPRWPQSTVLLIALSAVAGLILLDGSRAEALWDGHKLHAVCAQVRERQLGGDCAAYVRGVIDHFHEVLAARCPHQTVSFGAILEEVISYVEDHPSARDQPAPALILASLKQRYGCAF